MNADKPTRLSDYLKSIWYDTTDGKTYKRGNSIVIIYVDCPMKDIKEGKRNGNFKVIGAPITWSQRITGYEVKSK